MKIADQRRSKRQYLRAQAAAVAEQKAADEHGLRQLVKVNERFLALLQAESDHAFGKGS